MKINFKILGLAIVLILITAVGVSADSIVSGNLVVGSGVGPEGGEIQIRNSTGGTGWIIDDIGGLRIFHQTGLDGIFINREGKVGLGTNNPGLGTIIPIKINGITTQTSLIVYNSRYCIKRLMKFGFYQSLMHL